MAAVNYYFGDKLGLYTEVLKHSSGPMRNCAFGRRCLPLPRLKKR